MWVKICANTNVEDALLAAELGADAVGFVFAPSPRQVIPAQAAAIVIQLPDSLEKVGVFPAWPAKRILEAVEQAKLTTIQLHGTPDPELARTLYAHFRGRMNIIQVVHWAIGHHEHQAGEIMRQLRQLAAAPESGRILIDSKVGSASGGTGVAFPWEEARTIFAAYPKIILAGGLNPENVGDAVHQLQPYGVDVASGVEQRPGKKDPAKLRAFMEAARVSAEAL